MRESGVIVPPSTFEIAVSCLGTSEDLPEENVSRKLLLEDVR